MNQQTKSPAAYIKQLMGSGKIVFAAILMTVSAAALIYDQLQLLSYLEDSKFFTLMFISDTLGLGFNGLEYEPVTAIFSVVFDVLWFFGLVSIIPAVLGVISIWMIKSASASNRGATRRGLIGLNLFKINLIAQIVAYSLALVGVVIVTFIAFGSGVFSGNGSVAGILLLVIAAIIIVLCLCIKYYADYFTLLLTVSHTLRTGKNLVTKSGYVVVLSWIIGIVTILSSLGGNGLDIVIGIADGLSLILIATCFSNYKNIFGWLDKQQLQTGLQEIALDPAWAGAAHALGFTKADLDKLSQGQPVKGNLMYTMFGTDIADGYDSVSSQPTNAAVAVQSSLRAVNSPASGLSYSVPKTSPTLNYRMLPLFTADVNHLDERFTTLESRSFAGEYDYPIVPVQLSIIQDYVSEKKILRMAWKNDAPVTIKRACFNIYLKGKNAVDIGVFRDVSIALDQAAENGETLFAKYGIVLPEETENYSVEVTYVEFGDGLYRDKPGERVDVLTTNLLGYTEYPDVKGNVSVSYCKLIATESGRQLLMQVKNNTGNVLHHYDVKVLYKTLEDDYRIRTYVLDDTELLPGQLSETITFDLPEWVSDCTVRVTIHDVLVERIHSVEFYAFDSVERKLQTEERAPVEADTAQTSDGDSEESDSKLPIILLIIAVVCFALPILYSIVAS